MNREDTLQRFSIFLMDHDLQLLEKFIAGLELVSKEQTNKWELNITKRKASYTREEEEELYSQWNVFSDSL